MCCYDAYKLLKTSVPLVFLCRTSLFVHGNPRTAIDASTVPLRKKWTRRYIEFRWDEGYVYGVWNQISVCGRYWKYSKSSELFLPSRPLTYLEPYTIMVRECMETCQSRGSCHRQIYNMYLYIYIWLGIYANRILITLQISLSNFPWLEYIR